mmetsp:Transcript_36814/g.96956  ORF Transcript_36814/g.96956 Transcript_36814/m.96956 type:complete len:211 (+) Transcript_36814:1433-2065(+)
MKTRVNLALEVAFQATLQSLGSQLRLKPEWSGKVPTGRCSCPLLACFFLAPPRSPSPDAELASTMVIACRFSVRTRFTLPSSNWTIQRPGSATQSRIIPFWPFKWAAFSSLFRSIDWPTLKSTSSCINADAAASAIVSATAPAAASTGSTSGDCSVVLPLEAKASREASSINKWWDCLDFLGAIGGDGGMPNGHCVRSLLGGVLGTTTAA